MNTGHIEPEGQELTMHHAPHISGQRGFGLVEVLVAAAVFSLGLGSMSLLLLLAVQGTLAPRSDSFAALHARSLADSLRLVPDGEPVVTGGAAACLGPDACTPGEMAASIMGSWQRQVEKDIPTGRGLLCRGSALPGDPCGAADVSAVSISWLEADPDSNGERERRFRIPLPVQ